MSIFIHRAYYSTMEIRRAMALFRIRERIPIEELNTAFRGLVKKYHPDKVREYPEWAHERMAEINEAYEILASWIATPLEPESETRAEMRKKGSGAEESPGNGEEAFRNAFFDRAEEVPPLSGREKIEFESSFALFLDGLGLYYQYGLENPAYRGEGVRRFRFREAFRTASKGRDALEEFAVASGHPSAHAAARFARLTIADIDLGRPAFSGGDRAVRRLDERFRAARRMFDDAVKVVLYPELVPEHLKAKSKSGLYACYAEFVVFLASFTEGERRKAGILASARYDAFMDLLELRNSGLIDF